MMLCIKFCKNILKNPLTHIVVKKNTPTSTKPYDYDADDEPYEDLVDIPEVIEEDSTDGIPENNENPLTHIVEKKNTPTTNEPYDDYADDEPYGDPVDKLEVIKEDPRNGKENNDDISEEDAVDIPE